MEKLRQDVIALTRELQEKQDLLRAQRWRRSRRNKEEFSKSNQNLSENDCEVRSCDRRVRFAKAYTGGKKQKLKVNAFAKLEEKIPLENKTVVRRTSRKRTNKMLKEVLNHLQGFLINHENEKKAMKAFRSRAIDLFETQSEKILKLEAEVNRLQIQEINIKALRRQSPFSNMKDNRPPVLQTMTVRPFHPITRTSGGPGNCSDPSVSLNNNDQFFPDPSRYTILSPKAMMTSGSRSVFASEP